MATAEDLFRQARVARQAGDLITYRLRLLAAYEAKAASGQPVAARDLEAPWLLPLPAFPARLQGQPAYADPI
jgi:hypothetical protein